MPGQTLNKNDKTALCHRIWQSVFGKWSNLPFDFRVASLVYIAILILAVLVLTYFSVGSLADMFRGVGFFVGGGFVAVFGLRVAAQRKDLILRQTNNEAFTKSIELLGNQNTAVRQGGIYALERLAKDISELRDTVIKIIASYIRDRSQPRQNESNASYSDRELDIDIEAAFIVLKNLRNVKDLSLEAQRQINVLDLSNSNIKNIKIEKIDLSFANLTQLSADSCVFNESTFFDSDLNFSSFNNHCELMDTNFCKAKLKKAVFEGADLAGAKFQNADLKEAVFEGADLAGAQFQNADLNSAKFKQWEETDQKGKNKQTNVSCNMSDVDFDGAKLHGSNLTGTSNLTQVQIDCAEGNQETKLPNKLTHPNHWGESE